ELAGTPRLVVGPGALGVLGDVYRVQVDLAVLDLREGVDERGPAGAQGLDLGTGQREAGLEGVEDRVVVPRLAVGGDHLAALLSGHGRSPPLTRGLAIVARQQRQSGSQSSGCTGVPSTRTSKCRW